MSFPLQVCWSNEPGRNAEASGGNIGGCEATGQSEGRIGTGIAAAAAGFLRLRLTSRVALPPAVLGLTFFLMATFRLVATEDFFLVAEVGAILVFDLMLLIASFFDCVSWKTVSLLPVS